MQAMSEDKVHTITTPPRWTLRRALIVRWQSFALLGIVALYLAVTGYRLRMLPGEWYGDISIENREVTAILSGGWPWRFNMSAGPAYHYVVAGFAYIFGASYETYKLASVATGLLVVLLLYGLGQELFGHRIGLLAAFVSAVSFWLILFARLGNSPQILAPVLSVGSVYFLVRFVHRHHEYNVILSMILAGLGLFTYPSTFILPLVILALIVWQLLFTNPRAPWSMALIIAFVVLIPFLFWFREVINGSSAFLQGGYVSSKVLEKDISLFQDLRTFGHNMLVALGMFQWTGDRAFRTNVSGRPVLDPVSGVLMDLGLIWLILNFHYRSKWGWIMIPFLILLMPSAAPGLPPNEIPSASRALSVAPFVFLLVALGLDALRLLLVRLITWLGRLFRQAGVNFFSSARLTPQNKFKQADQVSQKEITGRLFAGFVVVAVLAVVAILNFDKYFNVYRWELPEHNQPWGYLIAQYIDTLPSNVTVELSACCWGGAGQPEPMGIYNVLKNRHGREDLISDNYFTECDQLDPDKSYVLILPPDPNGPLLKKFKRCFPDAQGQLHRDALNKPDFYSLQIK